MRLRLQQARAGLLQWAFSYRRRARSWPWRILDIDKSKQPLFERQHHRLKAAQSGVPVFLHSSSRIEALFFLHFLALLVNALLERQVRQARADRGIKKLPLYPEERECRAPSAERILETFASLQRHWLRNDGEVMQRFDPELTPLHRKLLRLVGLSEMAFANCLSFRQARVKRDAA